MLAKNLSNLFSRELEKVREEIKAYETEQTIWQKAEGINNSAGNLSLHISGNLQHFFGTMLGGTDYVRDREFEFNGKVNLQDLLDDLDAAEKAILDTLQKLTPEDFEKEFPMKFHGETITTHWFALHLYGHMTYHLGQINYHRRLLSK